MGGKKDCKDAATVISLTPEAGTRRRRKAVALKHSAGPVKVIGKKKERCKKGR